MFDGYYSSCTVKAKMGVDSIIKPKFYKITIHSSSAVSQGVLSQGWNDSYHFIDFPEILDHDKYQIAVESFVINTSVNTTTISTTTNNGSTGSTTTIPQANPNAFAGYIVSLPGVVQGNTYDTVSQSVSPSVLVTSGPLFNRFVDFDSIGYPLRDMSWMRGQNLRVTLSSLDGVLLPIGFFGGTSAFGAGASKWAMVLTVFPIRTC